MIFAAVGDITYNIVFVAHFLLIIVGAGMSFLGPLFVKRARRIGGRTTEDIAVETTNQVAFPALLLAGFAGMALVELSSGTFAYSMTWLSVAFALWIGCLVCSLVAFPPQWFNIFNASDDRRRLARMGLHLGLLLLLVVMVWKDTLF